MSQQIKELLLSDSFDAVIASTEVMATYALQTPPGTTRTEEHNSLTRWMGERYAGGKRNAA